MADDTGLIYRWSGSVYINISASPGSTDAVPEGATNLYFTQARVLATLLTGFSTAVATAVVATDTIIAAFGKVQGQINTIFSRTINGKALSAGNVTLTTTDINEGTNLYFTAARVLGQVLTGIVFTTNAAIVATDTILVAMGKLQAQLTAHGLLLPTSGQKDALVGNNGTPSSTNPYVTLTGLAAALSQSGTAVTRALNTAFKPSATKYVNCRYTLTATMVISVSGNVTSQCFLETSPDVAGAPSGTWTEVDRDGGSFTTTLVIGFAQTIVLTCHIAQLVAPNVWIRIRTSGTIAYISGQESTIG